MLVGITGAWGQTDYSGVYYIGTAGYNANNPESNYYLCPTEGWIYYVPENKWSNDGITDNPPKNPNPFLTTYKCKTNSYHSGNPNDAIWYVEKHPTLNYYYIRHASDGKYVISNGQISGTSNANRMRVHLESVAPEDLDDKALFSIYPYSDYLVISPKSPAGWNSNYKWYTVNSGNKDYLVGNGSNGGPSGYTATGGIIGTYTENDANAKFYLEEALSIDPPTIMNNYDGTFTITAATGATIYYTTNGTTPTTETTTTGTTSVTVSQTENLTVIKAIAKAFTSIGEIYGGGYGLTATMVGSPTVNINVGMGDKADSNIEERTIGTETVRVSEHTGESLTINEGQEDQMTVEIPLHKENAIGAIGKVFGGGNEAMVMGDTQVNIGTEEYVIIKTLSVGASVKGYYKKVNDEYTACGDDEVAVKDTEYYKAVIGADIRGNVYGGGNNAEVTGNTNVNIGKKVE